VERRRAPGVPLQRVDRMSVILKRNG